MMSRKGLLAIAALIILGMLLPVVSGTGATAPDPSSARPTQLQSILTPDRIVWISTYRPDQNYAGDTGVWVGYGPGHIYPDCCNSYRGLVTFDLSAIPATATISDVELRATIVSGHGTDERTYNVAKVTEPWTERSVNWNNQPSREGPTGSTRISRTSGTVSWSSTALRDLVQAWVNGTTINNGLYLRRAGDTSDPQHDRLFRDLQLVVTFQATTQPDLIISHMEITQAVQDWDNSIPLVQRKRTVVRVYVSACCQSTDVQDIGVRLEGQRPLDTSLGRISPRQPSNNRMSIPGVPVDPRTLRDDETRTFNFLLPTSWTDEDDVWLIATVNRSRRVVESNYDNNTRQRKKTFYQRPDLNFVGVIVWGTTETGFHYDSVSRDHFYPHLRWMKRIYPVPGIRVWRVAGLELLEYDPAETRPDGLPGRASGVLNDLAQRRTLMATAGSQRARDLSQITWYGLDSWTGFEPEMGGRYFGLASMDGFEATGFDTPSGHGVGQIMGHEIGHNGPFGRSHASDQCTNWPYTDEGNWCDINYPEPSGCIDEYGFDTVEMKAISPDIPGGCTMDLMAYGSPNVWISAYTYRALYDAAANLVEPGQTTTAATLAGPPRAVLLASGLVTQDDQVRMRPFYVVRTTAPVDPDPGTGEYSLALENADGQVLSERRFDALWTIGPPDGPPPVGVFGVRLLWDPAAARVVLRKGDQVLAVRQVSAHAPQVTVLSPTGGETWTGQQEVRWQASDEDDGPLVYLVLLSTDSGETWRPVGMNLRDTSYSLDADQLPGSEQAMIRVVASDGVRSNHGDSGLFAIPSKAPEVSIPELARGPVIRNLYSITLRAQAYDVEDGPLGGTNVAWASSQDGELGHGEELVVAQLSSGWHRLTVTATDQDGNHSTDAAMVYVTEGLPYDVFLPIMLSE